MSLSDLFLEFDAALEWPQDDPLLDDPIASEVGPTGWPDPQAPTAS
jgi:hypothetical protein